MNGGLTGDLRLAGRRLARSPGFTLPAIVTLALAIGATTAVFSLVHAALLRPLPFPEPERLTVLWENQPAQLKDREKVSAVNFQDWRRESRSFSALAAWTPWGVALTGAGEPEELSTVRASSGLFDVLGVAPALGRGFLPEEETPGRHRVAVLSHGTWLRRFGGDPAAVGRSVSLDGEPYQIIGVMPAGFRFPDEGEVSLWIPLAFGGTELHTRAERVFYVLGRLATGVDLASARAELATIARRLATEAPETNAGWGITALPAAEVAAAESRRPLGILLGAVGCVLLIACANVGHLFQVRAIERETELAVRVALGAAPGRLVRLLLLEGALIASGGGLAGLVVAAWVLPALRALDPGLVPGWHEVRLDGAVLLFAAVLLIGVTLACGLAPALRAIRRDPRRAMASRPVSHGLIVGEVAVSIALLIGAGLLLQSLLRIQRVDPGFQADRVLVATIWLTRAHYDEDARQAAFFAELVERLRGLPGVRAAGAVTTLPMNPVGIDYDLPFSADARPPGVGADKQEVDFRVTEGDYFRALGIPLLRGRSFGPEDRTGTRRVVVVNQTLASRFFPGSDPVGRQVWVGGGIGQATIVGVTRDVRHRGLADRPRPELYVPSAQYPHGGMTVVVRTADDPAALIPGLKAQVYGIDPDQPIHDIVTLPGLVSRSVAPRRAQALLLGGFAGLALLLAAVGVYGVIAYAVGRRTREIGIRIALGAGSAEIRRTVLGPGLALAGGGVLLGAAAAGVLAGLLRGELYEVSPHDPLTYAGAGIALLLVAAVACEIPARRAVQTDPVVALRSE